MDINLIGVPLKYGCDRDGVEFGPDRLRSEGIIDLINRNGHRAYDMGNIFVPYVPSINKYLDHHELKYLNTVAMVNENLANNVYSSLRANKFPFIIGGDHSLAMGSIAGASKYKKNLAVIWIDAHADINTSDTSPSGNIHGMPLAASMNVGHSLLTDIYFQGQKVDPENVYHIGGRDIDPGEFEIAKSLDLDLYTMKKVREIGLEKVIDIVIKDIRNSNVDGVHLSFDIDVMDPTLVPGTGTPVKDGFNMEETKFIFTEFLKEKFVTSMDFVEFNPKIDQEDMRTAKNSMEVLDHIFKEL